MANIRPRGNRWQARVTVDGHSVAKTFTVKTDAQKWARQQQVDMERGLLTPVPRLSVTLAEVLRRYLAQVTPTHRGATPEKYLMQGLLRSSLASKRIDEVTPKDIAAWRDKRLGEVSTGSVRRELDVLSGVFTVACREWQVCDSNPVGQIKKPPHGKARDRRLIPGEIDLIVEATESPDLPTIITLATETAMRRSEILGLRWVNIDLKRRIAHLPLTKNGDTRDVPLSTRAAALLASLPRRIDGLVFKCNGTSISDAFCRAVKRGRRRYEETCERQGVEVDPKFLHNLRFHDLRHEATSRLFERGLDVMEVATISGHRTLSMLRRYTHLRVDDLVAKLA